MITTPFHEHLDCELVREFPVSQIIQDYKAQYQIDVARYFAGIDTLNLYECPKSGIRFFLPNCTMGDSSFYEKLQLFDWYYMDWKWEHEVAFRGIDGVRNVLEIGSGKGVFVRRLTNAGIPVLGLELNEKEAARCIGEGLNVRRAFLEETDPATEMFDLICSFQVFEHIPDLDSILRQAVQRLKPNGRLLFSVPNMDAFIRYNDGGVLNFPPHHINWFSGKTFHYIAERYGLRLSALHYEPLQEYHYKWYADYLATTYFRNRIAKRLFYSGIGQNALLRYLRRKAPQIHGHSVMAEYFHVG